MAAGLNSAFERGDAFFEVAVKGLNEGRSGLLSSVDEGVAIEVVEDLHSPGVGDRLESLTWPLRPMRRIRA
jgi:hypothetical protein